MPKFRRKPVIVEAERRPSGMWSITSPPHLGLVHDVEFRQEFEPADDEAEKILKSPPQIKYRRLTCR